MRDPKKINILIFADSPTSPTGFGQVSKHIIDTLVSMDKFNISVLAANHYVDLYPAGYYPYTIYTNTSRAGGFTTFTQKIIRKGDFDILFCIGDTGIISKCILTCRNAHGKSKYIIAYSLFDTDSVYESHERGMTFYQAMIYADKTILPLASSVRRILKNTPEFGKRLISIPYGVETNILKPLKTEIRETLRMRAGIKKDDFVILNLNRNQFRKDLPRTIRTFKMFHEIHHNSKLWLHCKIDDLGGNIITQAYEVGLKPLFKGDSYMITADSKFDILEGYSRSKINQIYNMADVCISTTMGEGWGFSMMEAMATKTPVIFPNNTTCRDIIGKNGERGTLCESGTTNGIYDPNLWHISSGQNDLDRPLTNINSLLEALEYSYDKKNHNETQIENAYLYAKLHDWSLITPKWIDLFESDIIPSLP